MVVGGLVSGAVVVGEPIVVGGLVRGGVVVDAEKGIALDCPVSGLVVGDARLLDADETPDEEEATPLPPPNSCRHSA